MFLTKWSSLCLGNDDFDNPVAFNMFENNELTKTAFIVEQMWVGDLRRIRTQLENKVEVMKTFVTRKVENISDHNLDPMKGLDSLKASAVDLPTLKKSFMVINEEKNEFLVMIDLPLTLLLVKSRVSATI